MRLTDAQRWMVLWLGLWLLLGLGGRTALLRDPGTFWHVAVGQRALATGKLVTTDPFSFTRSGQPWVDLGWLSEIGMAEVVAWGGWGGLVVATAAVLAAVFASLGLRLLRTGLTIVPVVLVLMLCLLACSHHFHARPLIFTLAAFAGECWLLIEVDAGRRPLRQLWWLVPLDVLWTNAHGGVLGGLGTLWLVAAGWCVARWLNRPGPLAGRRDVLHLMGIVGAASLAVLVNPWGVALPRTWLAVMQMPLGEIIQEHAPLDLRQPHAWAAGGLLLLYAAGLLGVLRSGLGSTHRRGVVALLRRTQAWRVTWLLPLPWLILALDRVRNLPLLAVVTVLLSAELVRAGACHAWLRRSGWLVERASNSVSVHGRRSGWAAAGWLGAALLLGGGLLGAGGRLDLGRLDAARWPVALDDELRRLEEEFPGGRLFNDMNFGGYLIYFHPRLRVFVDDRTEIYGGEFLVDYDRVRRLTPHDWERWDREYGFCGALIERGTPLDAYLGQRPNWTLRATTPSAALYRRVE